MWSLFKMLTITRPRKRAVVLALFASPIAPIAVPLACGGGQGGGMGVRSPETSLPAPGPTATASSADAPDGTTTTNATLGSAQGVKLREMPAASATSGSAPASRGAHTHDPGRTQGDIGAAVLAHRDETRACYERALADHPGIEGDLVVNWTIDPQGNVTETSLDVSRSQIAEPTLVTCVSEVIKKVTYAASPGGYETKASYPFKFHPRHRRTTP